MVRPRSPDRFRQGAPVKRMVRIHEPSSFAFPHGPADPQYPDRVRPTDAADGTAPLPGRRTGPLHALQHPDQSSALPLLRHPVKSPAKTRGRPFRSGQLAGSTPSAAGGSRALQDTALRCAVRWDPAASVKHQGRFRTPDRGVEPAYLEPQ